MWLAPLVRIENHDAGLREMTVEKQRNLVELVLVRDEAGTGCDGHQHAAAIHGVAELDELRPLFHLGVVRADMGVLLLHVASYIR